MKIRHVLQKKGGECHRIGADEPLLTAVKCMNERRIGSLLVERDGEACGIVTERDVLRALAENGGVIDGIAVADVMSGALVTCLAEQTLDEAMDLLNSNATGHRIRHLPVNDGSGYCGMLSVGDVVDALLTTTTFENRLLKGYIKNWPEPEE